MNCLACGRYGEDDPSTGACAGAICPSCARKGYDVDNRGELLLPSETRAIDQLEALRDAIYWPKEAPTVGNGTYREEDDLVPK